MTYSKNYVLAVKDQHHKILREIEGKTYLPFYSEYSLFLKNNNWSRAACSVDIDGTDVLGGRELIIPSNGAINLERFITDGDLSKGQRFKFVPLSDSKVNDQSRSDNGIITIKFWAEKDPPSGILLRSKFINSDIRGKDGIGAAMFSSCCSDISDGNVTMDSFSSNLGNMTEDQSGATVEGSESTQSFSDADFRGKHGPAIVLTLKLMGRREAVTVEGTKKKFCTICGVKAAFSDKFCRSCGKEMIQIK